VFRLVGVEEKREMWDSKLTVLLAMLLALEKSGISRTV
jgi:hypothetical protein